MKAFTDITVLLDRSGSMATIKFDMEKAFNAFIEGHKTNPTTRVTLIQFDGENPYEVSYQSVPVAAVEPLRLNPRGSTPLLDAMAQTIDNTGSRYAALTESERPDQVLLVVITDGHENSSKNTTRAGVKQRVIRQKNDYKWEFVYLGANHDAFATGEGLGFDLSKTMWYDVNRVDDSLRGLTRNTVAYASASGSSRGLEASQNLNFTEDQLTKAAGDLDEVLKKIKSNTKA